MYGTRMSLQRCNAEERWMQMKSKLTQHTKSFMYHRRELATPFGYPSSLTANTFQMYLLSVILKTNKSDLWPQNPGVQTGLLSHYWAPADSTNSYQTCYLSCAPGPPLHPEVAPVIQRYYYDFLNVLFSQVIASEITWIVFFSVTFRIVVTCTDMLQEGTGEYKTFRMLVEYCTCIVPFKRSF